MVELEREGSMLRVRKGQDIISASEDYYDEFLTAQIPKRGRFSLSRMIGEIYRTDSDMSNPDFYRKRLCKIMIDNEYAFEENGDIWYKRKRR